jgi:hypothetical protein
VVVVLETDLGLLRAVLSEIDFSAELSQPTLVFFDGTEQGGNYSERLAGLDGLMIQGIQLVEHPASRARLGDTAQECARLLTETMRGARATVATALARSAHTIGSIFRNARFYVGGDTLAPLQGTAKGRLGIVVSAGPSLRRNMHLLAQPGVRDRCVIVATQTVLKPLLKEGIRPHFVASLDWHHISKRFFEGLTEQDVRDTTLILDPQANPVVAETFPGRVRVISAPHLDAVLGPVARETGRLQRRQCSRAARATRSTTSQSWAPSSPSRRPPAWATRLRRITVRWLAMFCESTISGSQAVLKCGSTRRPRPSILSSSV